MNLDLSFDFLGISEILLKICWYRTVKFLIKANIYIQLIIKTVCKKKENAVLTRSCDTSALWLFNPQSLSQLRVSTPQNEYADTGGRLLILFFYAKLSMISLTVFCYFSLLTSMLVHIFYAILRYLVLISAWMILHLAT